MKTNWRPTSPAFLDFETQSECPLTTVHKYSTHPSTKALTCVVKVGSNVHRFGPYLSSDDKTQLAAIATEHVLVAHNAPFDEAIWRHTLGLPPATWCDTLPMCRAAGFPGKLDDVGTLLTGEGKDKNGPALIRMLCMLKPGQKPPAVGPAHRLLLDYNVRDVELLELVYDRVRNFGEPDVMTVDNEINERGVPVDGTFLGRLMELYEENHTKNLDAFHERTGGINPSSPKQVKEWLTKQGFNLPGVNKVVFKELMHDPEQFFVGDSEFNEAFEVIQVALEQRREVVRVGKGKAETATELLEADGRIREQFVYWGSHLGRWSGRGLQLHNMPIQTKGVNSLELALDYDKIQEAAAAAPQLIGEKVAVADVLNAMLRHAVRADNLLVADFSSVEARCLAWISECGTMMELYRDPTKSLYLDMGKKLFGREIARANKLEYSLSKALILGCGYGMSGAKFEFLCKSRNTQMSILDSLGMSIKDSVKVYRNSYPEVPAIWAKFHRAVHETVKTRATTVCGKCTFHMVGSDLRMRLPSEREVVYRNARIESRVPSYCKLYGMAETAVPTVLFDKPRLGTSFLYGSKICENACQAICRDLLAIALVRCKQLGLRPCIHVHDEVVCEDEESRFEEFLRMLTDPPAWAEGFPILAEGYTGPIWTKQTKGFREASAMNGRLL